MLASLLSLRRASRAVRPSSVFLAVVLITAVACEPRASDFLGDDPTAQGIVASGIRFLDESFQENDGGTIDIDSVEVLIPPSHQSLAQSADEVTFILVQFSATVGSCRYVLAGNSSEFTGGVGSCDPGNADTFRDSLVIGVLEIGGSAVAIAHGRSEPEVASVEITFADSSVVTVPFDGSWLAHSEISPQDRNHPTSRIVALNSERSIVAEVELPNIGSDRPGQDDHSHDQ